MRELPASFTVYGSKKVLEYYGELLSLKPELQEVSSPPREKGLFLINTIENVEITPGKPSKKCGESQLNFLKRAVEDAKKGNLDAIITLPINKKVIKESGFSFPGHTEFLAESFKVKDFAMMLANEKLKVVLLTTHLPLKEVPKEVKKEKILSKLKLINSLFKGSKIGVCGLNPHAGEEGLFGEEEVKEIEPAVREAQKLGINAFGPYPSDTIFNRALKGEFEIVLAIYHDQGLIPVKLTGFGKSVNITLGLPIIRTSVDHGTAYDIAGKGKADNGSFKEAVIAALNLIERKKKKL